MSLWRKEASKRLPELQRIIASRDVDNPMMLWIEIHMHFDKLCEDEPPPTDLIGRIWDYAKWCMQNGNDILANAAAVGFCEHLIDTEAAKRVLPQIMNRQDYLGLRGLLTYHNTEEKFQEVLRLF